MLEQSKNLARRASFTVIVCAVELGRSCTSNDNFRARRAKIQHTAGKFLDGSSIFAVPLLEQLDHPLTIARASSRRVRGPLQRVPAFVARRDARVSATRQQERDDVLAVVLLHGTQRARMRIRGENSQRGRRKRFKGSKDPYRRPGQQRSAGCAALGVRVHPNGGMDEGREAQGPDLVK